MILFKVMLLKDLLDKVQILGYHLIIIAQLVRLLLLVPERDLTCSALITEGKVGRKNDLLEKSPGSIQHRTLFRVHRQSGTLQGQTTSSLYISVASCLQIKVSTSTIMEGNPYNECTAIHGILYGL